MAGGENGRAAIDYAKHYRSPRMIGMDANYGMMAAYQSMSWPRFVVIDRGGTIRFHGFPSDDQLSNVRKCVQTLVRSEKSPSAKDAVVENGVRYPRFVVDARKAHRERSPRLALDPNGRPAAVFYSNRDGSNNVYLRRRDARGRFSDEALTTGDADDYAPDCAFDSAGTLWVAWCSNRAGRYDVYVQSRRAGNAPETMQLSHSDDDAMCPRIAAGPGGRLAVAYYKWQKMGEISRDRDVYIRIYDPKTGTWGNETAVCPTAPAVEDHTDPDVVIDGQGQPWIVWSYDYHPQLFRLPFDTDQPSVFAVRISATGRRSVPFLAGTVGRRLSAVDLFPTAAIDASGALWCAWDARNGNSPSRAIRLARFEQEKFGKAVDVSARGAVCSTPELSPGKDGTLLAAWSQKAGEAWQGTVTILKDGKAIGQTTLDATPADVLFPQACQAPDGKVWVAYEQSDEKGARVVMKELTQELAGDRQVVLGPSDRADP